MANNYEEGHFRQKAGVFDGVKGHGKIKVDYINGATLVHFARHRFLEDQQIREKVPTVKETILVRWDWQRLTEKGERDFFQDPLKPFT